jgi:hypothetical protein
MSSYSLEMGSYSTQMSSYSLEMGSYSTLDGELQHTGNFARRCGSFLDNTKLPVVSVDKPLPFRKFPFVSETSL